MDFIGELIDEVIESVVEERWLPIVGYEGYEVSDLGRVKSLVKRTRKGELILSPSPAKDGYLRVHLRNNNSCKIMVHRLVLQAFLPIEEKEVDHINQIKTDNRLINLRWATSSENKRNKNKQKGCYSSIYKGVCWHKKSKKWRASCKNNSKNKTIGRFDTEIEAAKAYNAYIIANNLQEFAILNVYL